MPHAYKVQDKYFKKAKEEGKRARSYFKLDEIDKKHHLLKPGMHVIDLGAAPGSFMQYTRKIIGDTGFLVGVDLTKIVPLGPYTNVHLIQADIYHEEPKSEIRTIHPAKFDAIVTDLAPKTSGVKDIDQYKSVELSEEVLNWAKLFLKPNGIVVLKIFQGADFDQFLRYMKSLFQKVTIEKPNAVRDRSVEVYLVGFGFKRSAL